MSDLASIDAAVASIDEEITTIMERLAHLRRVREQLTEDKRMKNTLISPLRRLPTELVELFIHASLPEEWYTHGSGRAVIPLAQVCYRLRATALAMSDLWCKLTFPKKPHHEGALEKFFAYAECLLARACGRPVDLTMPEVSLTCCSDARVDRWVVTHMARFRSIEWYPSRVTSGWPSSTLDAPSLESLRVIGNRDCYEDAPCPPNIGLNTPHLREFDLCWFASISRITVCWRTLQSLKIETPSLDINDMHVLQDCTSLQTLELTLTTESGAREMAAAAPIFGFHALCHLTVVDYGHALCRHLFAPNLIDITMRSGCRVQSKPAAHVLPVLDMLRSPSCPLPEVVTIDAYGRYNLDDEGPDYGEYLHVLARIPELRCLKLVYSHTGACHLESLLEGLIVKPDAPVLLPALDHLALRLNGFRSFEDCDATQMREIIRSRWEAARAGRGRPITRLTLRTTALTCRRVCRCATNGDWQKQLEALGTVVDRTSCSDLP
ncbi:hypothetical protein K523DRAFT_421080 [Schizophyllum commune Tattone D]|nr:hypothetical protein K523DRAFT_421080 [Schizophyllum commune Tattone D]